MVKAETRPPRVVTLVATYRNRPSGDIVRATGLALAPADTGLRFPAALGTNVKSPSLPMVNADMVPPPLEEYRNRPSREIMRELGVVPPVPVGIGFVVPPAGGTKVKRPFVPI